MRIKTPEAVETDQAPMVESLVVRINQALTNGARQFFTTSVAREYGYDIPPGHFAAVKILLEKACWIVEVRGTPDRPWMQIFNPKENKGY